MTWAISAHYQERLYMARYTGPKLKVVRRIGLDLPGLTPKTKGEKKFPPGQHGPTKRRKDGDFAVRLTEKQKIRYNYGVSEKQLKKYFVKAHRSKHGTGEQLLTLLECRLDNIVFRAGFAPSIPSARQLVSHGHVCLNGKRVTIPSILVAQNDVVSIGEKAKNIPLIVGTLESPSLSAPEFLSVDNQKKEVTMKSIPQKEDVPFEVEESLIVEYYAKAM